MDGCVVMDKREEQKDRYFFKVTDKHDKKNKDMVFYKCMNESSVGVGDMGMRACMRDGKRQFKRKRKSEGTRKRLRKERNDNTKKRKLKEREKKRRGKGKENTTQLPTHALRPNPYLPATPKKPPQRPTHQ